ncbi:C4-dicarboxylate ABC transporter substrate-binding protein [Halalkalibacillus sediminis]|uniref:C4-dicarboxylate ABC transporter substrate-binding protein n=1 Tax=Halalkalibacillus sediminis TaxID=2018042 RepID=A0A2I0QUB0_9BACI|nr:DctP family TRAP transporter solute-binding subunit [Halalkalibacillus sediminis]PKR77935.1 C4-dicarboxylate ABC transporter substrate-binding protein [Halalkalibacillus sediminis]
MMKKLSLVMFTILLTILAACGSDSGSGSSEDATTIKLAHSGSESHQYHIAATEFKDLVEEKTDGSVEVEIHGNATLGSEAEAIEQVMDGSIEMTTVAADSSFANTVPEMNVFGIPYLFTDEEHVYSTLDGDIGQELLDLTEEHNMKGLGYWEVGFRHLTNNEKEIKTPEDVEGLKIRVQPSPVWEEHMRALGASPTPVDFNELYSSLDQGVVDGQENPLPTIDSMKFYEVQKYVAMTAHTYSPAIVVMNSDVYDGLNEDQQEAVQSAVEETTEYHRETLAEKEEEIVETLKENDVTITEPDRDAFREATKDVKDALSEEVPSDLIERIQE